MTDAYLHFKLSAKFFGLWANVDIELKEVKVDIYRHWLMHSDW